MIKEFANLTTKEAELLLKAPILASVLATKGDFVRIRVEKAEVIKLAHLKTFATDTLLIPYFKEVEKTFINNFEAISKKYTPFDRAKREALKKEINLLNVVIGTLDKKFASAIHRSLSGYAEYVKRSDRSVMENFIFPVLMSGLTG